MVEAAGRQSMMPIGYRWRGVGSTLVAAAGAWARRSGYHELTARSDTRRVAAHGFYPELGFVGAKEQRVYKKALG